MGIYLLLEEIGASLLPLPLATFYLPDRNSHEAMIIQD